MIKNHLLTLLVIIYVSTSVEAQPKYITGKAYDLETSAILYHEITNHIKNNDGTSKVITHYTDKSGAKFAERIMQFNRNRFSPDFTLTDFRSGYIEGAKVESSNKIMVFTRANKNEQLRHKYLSVPEPYVIDGGLTPFVHENWIKLLKGETITFHFIAPSKLDYYTFRVSKSGSSAEGSMSGVVFKLEPDSFLLRSLVDPIFISYSLETRDLLRFKGISNINNDEGKSHNVNIDFTENYK